MKSPLALATHLFAAHLRVRTRNTQMSSACLCLADNPVAEKKPGAPSQSRNSSKYSGSATATRICDQQLNSFLRLLNRNADLLIPDFPLSRHFYCVKICKVTGVESAARPVLAAIQRMLRPCLFKCENGSEANLMVAGLDSNVARSQKTKSGLTAVEALDWFKKMGLIRRFEERAEEAYGQGKIGGFLHLYIGEEAIAVGALAVLMNMR